MKTVCVTGHRPTKLPWGYSRSGTDYENYIKSLDNSIAEYLKNDFNYFISGMALGVDMDFAETILRIKEFENPNIYLECAIPCPNQTCKWSSGEVKRYNRIISRADKITLVNDHYFRACMIARNRYMVNMSDAVLAVWNGELSGGTWQTVKYAMAKGKKIDIIHV